MGVTTVSQLIGNSCAKPQQLSPDCHERLRLNSAGQGQGSRSTARAPGRACGGFLDDVLAGQLSHAEQPQLEAAVQGARRRTIGQAGAFGWDRRDSSVLVAPLVAVTLARFGATTAGRRRTGRAVFV